MGRTRTIPLVPRDALAEWIELVSALAVHGPTPCEVSATPDDWHADRPRPIQNAVDGCRRCGAAPECAAYARAADERHGVWGWVIAEDRATLSRSAA